jgi:hypothetical protein
MNLLKKANHLKMFRFTIMNRPMARGNNVKRFEQAFSLEKRYIKTLHRYGLSVSSQNAMNFLFFQFRKKRMKF